MLYEVITTNLGLVAFGVFLASRANGDAEGTTTTVRGGDLHGELHALELFTHGISGLEGCIGTGGFQSLGGGDFHPDTTVRANQ